MRRRLVISDWVKLIPKYCEIRYYVRDPDGYIIEVGQNTDLTYG